MPLFDCNASLLWPYLIVMRLYVIVMHVFVRRDPDESQFDSLVLVGGCRDLIMIFACLMYFTTVCSRDMRLRGIDYRRRE